MSYDRMFRGDPLPQPVATANDIYRETMMEDRLHPSHCNCEDCAQMYAVGHATLWTRKLEYALIFAGVIVFVMWVVPRVL